MPSTHLHPHFTRATPAHPIFCSSGIFSRSDASPERNAGPAAREAVLSVVLCACCRAALQDPARVRLHEEMTRLTRRINVSNTELDNLSKASKAQTKKLSKLQKDLAALQEARVSDWVCGQHRTGTAPQAAAGLGSPRLCMRQS